MSTRSFFGIALGIIISCATMIQGAKADEWNQQTKVTFNQPVEVPGRTLQAGTYWFVLANSDSDRDIVQIFSEDWSTVYATVATVPSELFNPPDDTLLSFAEDKANGMPALVKWFYPGETTGHEFEYPKSKESTLAQSKRETILVGSQGSTVGF
jgi:hypothetical protein